ncbi:hypothetical protein BDR03DRAFT_948220 [Suillus americanus]|nr:hypothetical protein BDR03DRAFT_948220 [Suillus americanus]
MHPSLQHWEVPTTCSLLPRYSVPGVPPPSQSYTARGMCPPSSPPWHARNSGAFFPYIPTTSWRCSPGRH